MSSLAWRRPGVVLDVPWGNETVILTINRDPDTGDVCEVFGDGLKVGSDMDLILKDCCRNLSLQMQDGIPPSFFAHACARDRDENPQSLLGLIADTICAEQYGGSL